MIPVRPVIGAHSIKGPDVLFQRTYPDCVCVKKTKKKPRLVSRGKGVLLQFVSNGIIPRVVRRNAIEHWRVRWRKCNLLALGTKLWFIRLKTRIKAQNYHRHYWHKIWNIWKSKWKHSYSTFWFAGNGLALTTNKFCDLNATIMCSLWTKSAICRVQN